MDAAQREALQARHAQDGYTNQATGEYFRDIPYCLWCQRAWPCDAAQLLAALAQVQAERDALKTALEAYQRKAWVHDEAQPEEHPDATQSDECCLHFYDEFRAACVALGTVTARGEPIVPPEGV